jgi:hypothetical protein
MHTDIVKNHRTILFVDARNPTGKFTERANRLIESLNGANIKVDVHAVTHGSGLKVAPVEQVGDDSYLYDGVANESFDIEALTQLAREYGYDQVLFSIPG